MMIRKILGLILIAAGIWGLINKSVNINSESHKADIGPVDIKVQADKHVVIPPWAAYAAIGLGALLLVVPGGRRN